MTETSPPYRVNQESSPQEELLSPSLLAEAKRKRILRSDYFYHVRFTVNAFLIRGEPFEDYDDLISKAIVITDRLIERVEEKI